MGQNTLIKCKNGFPIEYILEKDNLSNGFYFYFRYDYNGKIEEDFFLVKTPESTSNILEFSKNLEAVTDTIIKVINKNNRVFLLTKQKEKLISESQNHFLEEFFEIIENIIFEFYTKTIGKDLKKSLLCKIMLEELFKFKINATKNYKKNLSVVSDILVNDKKMIYEYLINDLLTNKYEGVYFLKKNKNGELNWNTIFDKGYHRLKAFVKFCYDENYLDHSLKIPSGKFLADIFNKTFNCKINPQNLKSISKKQNDMVHYKVYKKITESYKSPLDK
jgi:hypothetical protein